MSLASLVLADPDGQPVPLAELSGQLVVVQLVRYFGCLPCQEWLVGLDAASPTLAAHGARPIAIGGSADYQARWLRDHRRVAMTMLIDPDQQVRTALGVADLGVRLADPRGLAAYATSLIHGFRPQRITRDTLRAPAVAILDHTLTVRWRFVGDRIGDYPSIETVLNAVDSTAGRRPPTTTSHGS